MTDETKDQFLEQPLEDKSPDAVTRALGRMQRHLNQILTIVLVAVPVMFALGLGAGYLVWGQTNGTAELAVADIGGSELAQQDPNPPVQDTANQPLEITIPEDVDRYEIEITENDPVRGPEDALVTIIEFSDFECPYCQRYFQETYSQILENYGDQVRYVFKDLPLTSIHPNAVPAAAAAQCANDQNTFWEYHDLLFTMEMGLNQEAYLDYAEQLGLDMEAFETCVTDGRYEELALEDTNILTALGAPISTPTFFINGIYISGAQPFDLFSQVIEHELELAN